MVSILALITLAGCHKGSSDKNLIGQYSLVEIEKDGQAILADEIKVGDVTGFIIFNEDGTGTFMMLNDRYLSLGKMERLQVVTKQFVMNLMVIS